MDYSKEIKELYLMEQISMSLFSVINKLQVFGDKYFKDITIRQYMMLITILHLPKDETTLVNIANQLGTSKQSANKLVAILGKKGYVSSVPSTKDGRAINLIITPLGMKALVKCSNTEIDFLSDLFENFTIEHLESLWKSLKTLYYAVDQSGNIFEENIDYKLSGLHEFQENQSRLLEKFAVIRRISNNEK